MSADLSLKVSGVSFANPVLVASGTFGYGREFSSFGDLSKLGGIVTKGISLRPRLGNPVPRICETASGMLNSIGLANVGLRQFLDEKMDFLSKCQSKIVVNIFGENPLEYVELVQKLEAVEGIDVLELNISCPNVQAGGMEFGVEPKSAYQLVKQVRSITRRPLWVKLSPNVTDIVEIARACVAAGADGLVLINTLKGMAIDAHYRRPRLATIYGGLSGPAIKPIALRMVHQVSRAKLGVPLIGVGGIMSGEDVVEFLLAGASLVQVGTANLSSPVSAWRIIDELFEFCEREKISRVEDLIGALAQE